MIASVVQAVLLALCMACLYAAVAAGLTLTPGLIDMHVHHPPARAIADTQLFALLHLAHGTTAVRDTGNFDGSILGIRDAVRNGELAGPRIFACGPIIDGDPPVWPGSIVATDAASGERAAEQIAAQGFDCIKVYQNLNAEALAGARRAAAMRAVNPAFIPRNHLVEEALSAAANDGDLSPLDNLLTVLSRPYDDQPDRRLYAEPPRPDQVVRQTFCGT